MIVLCFYRFKVDLEPIVGGFFFSTTQHSKSSKNNEL